MRIHEFAKELKMENKDLLAMLEKMGLSYKSVHSTLEESDVERVKNQINLSRKEGLVEKRIKPTVIRRRVMREATPPPSLVEEADKEIQPAALKTTPLPESAVQAAGKPLKRRGEKKIPSPDVREKETAGAPESPAISPLPSEPISTPRAAKGASPVREKQDGISAETQTTAAPLAGEVGIPSGSGEAIPSPPSPAAKPPEPVAEEKPKIVERLVEKPKKRYEPAKIIERPTVPPPSVMQEYKEKEGKGPSTIHAKPPIILQRPVQPVARPVTEEEGRGRRKKRLKKDVQVLEEGKPNRVRVISTKKRAFREYDYYHEERDSGTLFLDEAGKPRVLKERKVKSEITVPKPIKRKIRVAEAILVGELAKRMGVKASEVIKKFMNLGLMVTINQIIDTESAALVATDFGYEVEKTSFEIEDLIEEKEQRSEDLVPRPPVVTIMGHVDHGKTSLLDAIRETNVTEGEAGGITQHIGAYEVEVDHRKVVFLDTPGHEAFTSMRARGAKVTDIVVLVVAADDGVMNQTVEAIDHAKAANVPIIVAINKIDKPNANSERVKQGLSEYGLIPEAWGGQTIFTELSAKQKIGLKELLEMILLQADILELKGNPSRPMTGAVIEAKLDRGRGPVATVLIQDGSLRIGDAFVSGTNFGHVRAMINDRGERIQEAGPSTPVEVIGFSSVPNAGDPFIVVTDERRAKELATQRFQKQREVELAKSARVTLEDFYNQIKAGSVKDLNLILKADVQGSIEALGESLRGMNTENIRVNVLHASVGAINESDCMLASASEAIILGFNVKVEPKAQALAEQEKIDIRLYNVIYEALNDVRKAMEGLLEPVYEERLLGRAEVRQIFNISRVGTIAGSYVLEGKILRGSHVHVMRDGKLVHEGNISSLKRLKDDVREVASGFECGIAISDFREIQTNDIIESYGIEKVSAHL